MKIGVVGLGLIGGSLAKSIKTKTLHTVYGLDRDEETMLFARMCGAIDEALDEKNIGDCDIILVAIRPRASVMWIEENASHISKKTVVVDMCGVKRVVCGALADSAKKYGFSYVGGHPMAGKETSGFVNSVDGMFDGASMILTPDENSSLEMLEMLKIFFTDIGFGSMKFTTPEEHDKMIAYTSQLAHVASSAFVKSPTAQNRRGFSGGSYRDMTRVARLDENMWTELFLANDDNLVGELELYIENLKEYLEALKARDEERIRALLKDGRIKKAEAGGN